MADSEFEDLTHFDRERCMSHSTYSKLDESHQRIQAEVSFLKSHVKDSTLGDIQRVIKNRLLKRIESEEKEMRQQMAGLARLILTNPRVCLEEELYRRAEIADCHSLIRSRAN